MLHSSPDMTDHYLTRWVNANNNSQRLTSFPLGCTVVIQCEDGGPWTHRVIKEANKSDYNGRSYIIKVLKMGRLIIWNIRHIYSTPIWTEQYHQEQIKRQMEDKRTFSWRQWEESNRNTSNGNKQEEIDHITPIQQYWKTYPTHIMSDDMQDSITKMTHMQLQSGRVSKSLKKWNKDLVKLDKLQTRKARNQCIIIIKMTHLAIWLTMSYSE